MTIRHLIAAGFAGLLWARGLPPLGAEEVVAVLSSDSPYYQEALEGFREEMGKPVEVLAASQALRLPVSTRVVVAFGKKATALNYPESVTLIYVLAPNVWLNETPHQAVKVSLCPDPQVIPKECRRVQPELRRLAVLYSSPGFDFVVSRMKRSGNDSGMEIQPVQMEPNELPDRLRELVGKTDAIFLLPDPSLINNSNLLILRSFSLDNRIPYYAATSALVEKGATAAIASDFKEMGRSAAAVAMRALRGELRENYVFPERYDLTLSLKAVETLKMQVPPETLKRARQVP